MNTNEMEAGQFIEFNKLAGLQCMGLHRLIAQTGRALQR